MAALFTPDQKSVDSPTTNAALVLGININLMVRTILRTQVAGMSRWVPKRHVWDSLFLASLETDRQPRFDKSMGNALCVCPFEVMGNRQVEGRSRKGGSFNAFCAKRMSQTCCLDAVNLTGPAPMWQAQVLFHRHGNGT
jgi:hypothetical protein